MANMELVTVRVHFKCGRTAEYSKCVRVEYLWATQKLMHVSAEGYIQSHSIDEISSITIVPHEAQEKRRD